jgi:serine/threonine protein kinase
VLSAGNIFGPYEIAGAIGAGGMGEVYRARDTRLGRDVAMKVLPDAFARDAERMARLRREAQVLASLNHPHIAAIYGFEDADGTHALVMELAEGPTLAERIAKGPIPLDEALPIAKQIAEALEYAHERGIVHRDLKPANIKLAANETVKILDFGLAKAMEGETGSADLSNSPTLTAIATRAGFLLGTAAYMSPEQAKGKSVDRRADIWAFGCVFYEMLTGRLAFSGETVSDTLAAVIRAEPDWSELPKSTPQTIHNLLRRCLQKEPRQRLQAIGDGRIAIEEMISGAGQASSPSASAEPTTPRWLRVPLWALAGILTVALAATFLIFPLTMREQPARAIVSEISPPANANLALSGNFSDPPALSPDGKCLAFGGPPTFGSTASGAQPQLWVRPLDSGAARPLAGTNGATFPFWSPDSRYIGCFANGRLNRIDATGGPPLALADAPDNRGGNWGRDGSILFAAQSGPIYRVSDSGGTPQPVTKLNTSRQEVSHRWPQFLPDGKHFLFYVYSANGENSGTYAGSLAGGEPKLIVRGGSDAVYTPPGYLLFVSQGTLMAQAFDANNLSLTGDAVPIGEHAGVNLSFRRGVFTVSENGILCYGTGNPSGANSRLLWFDPSGKQIGEIGTPANYVEPSLSPDERELAVAMLDPVVGSPSI